MRILSLNHVLAVTIALFTIQPGTAQEFNSNNKDEAVRNIAKYIAANYVNPDKGGKIASHIQAANFKGQFNKATTWKEFNEMVTKELSTYGNDGHLYVRHDPEAVKDLQNPSKPSEPQNTSGGNTLSKSTITESKILDNNIGYLRLTEIMINKNNLDDLYQHMNKINGTKALIIDLRDNGGGGSDVGPVLESFFLQEGMPTLTFVTRDQNYRTDSTVSWLKEKRYDKPVYLITNRGTASAAEAFAFVLQQNRRAKIVGERSAGAANMNSWYAINDENFVSVSTASPTIPGKNISWEQTGLQPDIKAKNEDPLTVAVREATKL